MATPEDRIEDPDLAAERADAAAAATPRAPEFADEHDLTPDSGVRAQEEAEAAAAEAGAIGGPTPNEDLDPADRPLAEAGQGEAEGFEQAEADLIETASHGEPGHDPLRDAFTAETESGLSGAEHAEADAVRGDSAADAEAIGGPDLPPGER